MKSYTIIWPLLVRAFDATIQWLSQSNIICMYTFSLWYLGCFFFSNKVDWNPSSSENCSFDISWAALIMTSLGIEPCKMVSLWVKCSVMLPLCNQISKICGINSSVYAMWTTSVFSLLIGVVLTGSEFPYVVILVVMPTEILAKSKQCLAFSMYVFSPLNDSVQGISKPLWGKPCEYLLCPVTYRLYSLLSTKPMNTLLRFFGMCPTMRSSLTKATLNRSW